MTFALLYSLRCSAVLVLLAAVLAAPTATRAQDAPHHEASDHEASDHEASPNCLPSQPPAAVFVLPQASVVSAGQLTLALEPAGSLSNFTARVSEPGRAGQRPLVQQERTFGSVDAQQRLALDVNLPNVLSEQAAPGARPLGRGRAPATPVILQIEAEGTLADGQTAYSTDLITFEEVRPGVFRPLTLDTYLQAYGGETGALHGLDLNSVQPGRGEPSDAEPVDVGDRYMDASGHVTLLPVGGGKTAETASTITVTVSGYIYMRGSDGVDRPAPHVEVAVWEDDGNSAYASFDNILLTNSAGYFSTVVTHDDGDSSLELFLRVRTINSWVRMGNYYDNGQGAGNCTSSNNYCGLSSGNNQYQWDGPVVTGVTSGTRQMNYTVADSRKGAAQIFVWLNEAGSLTRTSFDPGQARAVYGLPGTGAFSTPAYNHNLVFSTIHGNRGGEDVSYHEHGHLTMYRRNGYRNPNVGGPHSICSLIHPAFAWSEGWATGFTQYVDGDGFYNANNLSRDYAVENAHSECYRTNTTSQHDEMWVAAAVNDFYDIGEPSGGDDPADRVHSFHDAMEIIRTTNIDSIVEFYDRLIASSTTTALEEHYTSRAARYNKFDCCINLIPAPSPLTVSISGPIALGWKDQGTLTANAQGGSGGYAYTWHRRTGGQWSYAGSTRSITMSMVFTDGVEYKVDVQSGSSQATDTHFIYYCDTNMCIAEREGDKRATETVETYALEPAYPNPFNPSTQIRFALPEYGHVRLAIYDLTGREVARLVDGPMQSGTHTVTWSAGALPSGTYFYRIDVGAFTATRPMSLVK